MVGRKLSAWFCITFIYIGYLLFFDLVDISITIYNFISSIYKLLIEIEFFNTGNFKWPIINKHFLKYSVWRKYSRFLTLSETIALYFGLKEGWEEYGQKYF